MELTLARSEAAKHSKEWGVKLVVLRRSDRDYYYKRKDEVSKTEIENIVPDDFIEEPLED